MKKYTAIETKFFGELAHIAETVSPEEWSFYSFVDEMAEQIHAYMDEKNITKADLANRMGTSRAYVTKVLAGDSNMTFKTFTKLMHYIGAKPEIRIVEKNSNVKWYSLSFEQESYTPKMKLRGEGNISGASGEELACVA